MSDAQYEEILAKQFAMNRQTWAAPQWHGVQEQSQFRLGLSYGAASREGADATADSHSAHTNRRPAFACGRAGFFGRGIRCPRPFPAAFGDLFSFGIFDTAMKTLTIILFCFTLGTMSGWADDFHLVQTVAYGDTLAPAGKLATNSIYVLLLPIHMGTNVVINPVVLRHFDPTEIGKIIGGAVTRGFLPAGSILHFDPSPQLEGPPDDQVRSLIDYCKKMGYP